MARFSKLEVLSVIKNTGMVPVFYHKDATTAKQVLRACYEGGVRAFEFTNRGDFAHEIFAELEKYAARELPGLIMGAGSIVDEGTAALYIQSGANFIVGPLFNLRVARTCNRRLIPYMPGCGSVTEVGTAQEAGCDLCKIFPAGNVGGPSFVKSMMAPMPWSMLMVTGSVEPVRENLSGWFMAGVTCVGMGSQLFPQKTVEAGDWETITLLCKNTLCIIKEERSVSDLNLFIPGHEAFHDNPANKV
jgi:2-dehydro-3-deoxyphosphogluconate aldolase/(4S)-4-hydroxy-2-oxoglutarate aldolase